MAESRTEIWFAMDLSNNETEWIGKQIAELVEEYGSVPPPWFLFPDTHPYDIGWRMGAGESHLLVFSTWWKQTKNDFDEAKRIEYFRRWPPPPCWLPWMIDIIWDLDPLEMEDPEAFDYSPYFARTDLLVRARKMLAAWKWINPALTFRDLSPDSLQADLDEEQALSSEFTRLQTQLLQVRNRRKALRLRIWDRLKRLKVGIRGIYGDDSPEYKLIGGTRKSERKPYVRTKKANPAQKDV